MPSENPYNTFAAQKQAEIKARFMNLYQSNPKGHGFALKEGLKYDENNNKWKPDAKWSWESAREREWEFHLKGVRFLGLGPNFDNATTYWGCIDIDQIEGESKYQIDLAEEIKKLRESGLSKFLVPDMSKNGGFHLKVFFSESVSCTTARRLLTICASLLGYAKCEIFPKQIGELTDKDDCPNWVFMPYGPIWDVYAEQYGLSDSSNALTMEEYLVECENKRMNEQQVAEFFKSHTERQKINGSSKIKGNIPKGLFVDGMSINEIFKGGPPCLWILAHKGVPEYQHNYLVNALIFVKKKFPDNHAEALRYINQYVLNPHGDPQKAEDIIKTSKDRNYTYRCKDQPICDYCDSQACRKQPYGVGSGEGRLDWEFGMIIIKREPRIFIINMGDKRVSLTAKELMNQNLFIEKCIEMGAPYPDRMKRDEWDKIIKIAVEDAQMVEPSELMKTNADEWETIQTFFGIHIPNGVRRFGLAFLNGRGSENDVVRVDVVKKLFFFKFQALARFCHQIRNDAFAKQMRILIDKEGIHLKQEVGSGNRGWFRGTWALPFEKFNEFFIDKLLNPEKYEKESEGEEE